jgi:hypothetical protein
LVITSYSATSAAPTIANFVQQVVTPGGLDAAAIFLYANAPATVSVDCINLHDSTLMLFELQGQVVALGPGVGATAAANPVAITFAGSDSGLAIVGLAEDVNSAFGSTPPGWTAQFELVSGEPAAVFTQSVPPGSVTFSYNHGAASRWGAAGIVLGAPGVPSWAALTTASVVTQPTANYAMYADDEIVLASGTSTITLPTTPVAGRRYTVKNSGTGTITITSASGTIDGAATAVITSQYNSLDFVSDGTNWFTV